MMDLENRLRSTFTEMADEQPPSADPRGDLGRRLADRGKQGWRTPALVAAAAAVVAAVAVPAIVFGGEGGDPPGPGTSVSVGDQAAQPEAGGMVMIGTFKQDGETLEAFAWLEGTEVCVRVLTVDGQEVKTTTGDPVCAVVEDVQLPVDQLVQALAVLPQDAPDTGPLPNLMLFLTEPQVATLEVRDHAGAPVDVREIDANDDATLWLVDFAGQTQGFGFTAKDENGTVLEEALT